MESTQEKILLVHTVYFDQMPIELQPRGVSQEAKSTTPLNTGVGSTPGTASKIEEDGTDWTTFLEGNFLFYVSRFGNLEQGRIRTRVVCPPLYRYTMGSPSPLAWGSKQPRKPLLSTIPKELFFMSMAWLQQVIPVDSSPSRYALSMHYLLHHRFSSKAILLSVIAHFVIVHATNRCLCPQPNTRKRLNVQFTTMQPVSKNGTVS